MKYVKVVIDNANDNTDILYTYRCEVDDISIGTKVFVPFARGNKRKEAYVFQVMDQLDEEIKGIKSIADIASEWKLTEEVVNTCIWMKNQYLCRYIDAIKCFTPSGSSSKRGKVRRPYQDLEPEPNEKKPLTPEQEDAVDEIVPVIREHRHRVFLLHGVTSSGKTEVYTRVVEACLAEGKSVILLVPEISLTGQTIDRIMGRFGSARVAVLHSKLSLGERYDEWMRINRGEVDIVIGARSGIFAPLPNCGAIILDEEHETTYKSDMTPKYDAVEVAIKRAQENHAVVLLGSATPSLVTAYRAEQGKYEKVSLYKRYNQVPMPEVEIVDMREELKGGNKTIFSVSLYQQMKEVLAAGRQVILFLNRRGYSTFVSCRSCGYVMKCSECGISLTYHKSLQQGVCHFCGYRQHVPTSCPVCESPYIRYFGSGTEKVEEAAKELFPDQNVERLDLDTVSKKGSLDSILNRFKKGKTTILIGTQLVAKGLDFANVALVGIVSADVSLNIPDFRSAERTFQLITQAAGRAGRGREQGKVVIQSYTPDHYSILAAADHDYAAFYQKERMIREQTAYPPFSDLIQIVLSAETEEEVERVSRKVVDNFLALAGREEKPYVLGPGPAPMNKIKGLHRYQLLIKCMPGKWEQYGPILNKIKLGISTDKKTASLISIDRNPYSFL